jgi:hypothetical protein
MSLGEQQLCEAYWSAGPDRDAVSVDGLKAVAEAVKKSHVLTPSEIVALARELRSAGVLHLKMPGLELALAPDLSGDVRETKGRAEGFEFTGDVDTEPPRVATPAYKSALGTFLDGGGHAQG